MALTTKDDVYDDPDNILAEPDTPVLGGVELSEEQKKEPSQSIFTPERANDDRGPIDELEPDGAEDDSYTEIGDANMIDNDDDDADRLSDVHPSDEQDSTDA